MTPYQHKGKERREEERRSREVVGSNKMNLAGRLTKSNGTSIII